MGKFRDYLALIIGVLLLCFASFFMYKSDFQSKEMFYFIILGFSLGLLSFLIIGKITGEGRMLGVNIKSFSGGFAVFIIVILLFVFKSGDTSTEIMQISNPQDTAIWNVADGQFKWFNAPFGYAANKEHARTKFAWFKKPNFTLEILMFLSADSTENHALFNPRLENLRRFLIHMEELNKESGNKVKIQDRITIKVQNCDVIPSTSFFTTKNSNVNKPYTIIYIIDRNIFRPTKCFTSFSKDLNETLAAEFNSYFDNLDKELSIAKLLDKTIPLSTHSLAIFL